MSDLHEVVSSFRFDGKFSHIDPLLRGNINDTYIAYFIDSHGGRNRYIVQRINHNVFKDPVRLMDNVIAITRHIREKTIGNCGDPAREALNFIPQTDGSYLYRCSQGSYWRAYTYIDDVRTYAVVENPIHFYHTGRAFGKFQRYLSDFPAEKLYETIPDFHHTPKRYAALMAAVRLDPADRVKTIRDEIRFLEERADRLSLLTCNITNGNLPLRVTHNDTKFNNVLIDNKTGEGICVIDLDTVMPGSSLYDFGDSIRSGANRSEEEEPDLAKVSLDMELYEQFTRGFLEYTHDFLTPFEIDHLPFSPWLLTIEQAIRFLTDYINGDIYYKTAHETQNLIRARVQLRLVSDMESKYDKMKSITEKYTPKSPECFCFCGRETD